MDDESPVTQDDANESFFSPSITVKDELELDSPSSRRVKLIPTHLRQKSFARGGKGALDFASKKGPLDRAAEMPEPDVPQEEVLAKCGMKPSAAFPTGMDNIGPHNFRKLKLLGKGGAGTVYLVNLRGTDLVYAMKELTKEDMIKGDKVLRVMTEREILATANHPFIVTIFSVLARQPNKRLQEHAAKFYAAEVLLALEYLHYLGFFYRDLKPENILMRDSGHIALTDFDLSKQAQAVSPKMIEHQRTALEKLSNLLTGKLQSKLDNLEFVTSEPVLEIESTSFVGTLEYLAPELVKGEPQNSAVDWWTLGILLYEMMCGTTPFRSATSDEVLAKIVCSDRIHWESGIGSPDARKLVKKLLHRDPKKRLGAEQGATEIKKSNFFASINFSLIRNEKPPIIPSDVPSLSDFDGVDLERDERLAKHMGDSDSDPDDYPPTDNDKAFAQFDMQRAQTDLSQY